MVVASLTGSHLLPEARFALRVADEAPGTLVYAHLTEALDAPYEADLVLASPNPAPSPERWLGQRATVEIERGPLVRRVHGVVRRVEDLGATGTHRYTRLVVVPALWLLSQRVDSRIFQDMPVSAIVREVLRDAGVYQSDGALVVPAALDGLAPREYCVQYRERDLDFVLRLLQEEGIPLWFDHHRDDAETLVLGDEPARWKPVATYDGAATPVMGTALGVQSTETLRWLDVQGALASTGEVLREYDFTRPSATLHMTPAAPGAPGARSVYDYPARFHLHAYADGSNTYEAHDGTRQARIRHEMRQAPTVVAEGAGNVTGFLPGRIAHFAGHLHHAVDGQWLLTRVEHTLQAWSELPDDVRDSEHLRAALARVGVQATGKDRAVDDRYANRFRAIPAATPWRPARTLARPLVYGIQTATVVGPPGEEIHVDFHARIKVQFHWDRQGRRDDKSSCWMRSAHNWSGPHWGFQFVPRVGMEVVVQFLEGDPDRPLVTGCVYNGENHSPYGLPGEKTRSAIRTQSTPGGGGYNELRFEDKAGQEEVYLRAQKDLNEWVLHDQGTKVDHDQTLAVGRHRIQTVGGNERLVVKQNRTAAVQRNESLEVDENMDLAVHGPRGYSVQVDETLYLRAEGRIILECGDSTIHMTPDGITVRAKTVRIEGEQETVVRGGVVKIN
jgi:type VI secretion system secreted protein VgrG